MMNLKFPFWLDQKRAYFRTFFVPITRLLKNENFTSMISKHVWIALGFSIFFINETFLNIFWWARQNFATKLLLMSFKCWWNQTPYRKIYLSNGATLSRLNHTNTQRTLILWRGLVMRVSEGTSTAVVVGVLYFAALSVGAFDAGLPASEWCRPAIFGLLLPRLHPLDYFTVIKDTSFCEFIMLNFWQTNNTATRM